MSNSHHLSSRVIKKNQSGYTLIEVLIAISVLSILMSAVYGIFASISSSSERLSADSEAYHKARVVFDRLGRELRGIYFNQSNDNLSFHYKIADDGFMELSITTTALTPTSHIGTGITNVVYRLSEDNASDGKGFVLLRDETPIHNLQNSDQTTGMMRLIQNVDSMSLRFQSEGTWQETWDGKRSGLPDLVELNLTLNSKDRGLESFQTMFDIPKVVPR